MKLKTKIITVTLLVMTTALICAGLASLYRSNASMMDIGGPIDNGKIATYGSNAVAKAPSVPYVAPHSSKYTIAWSSLDLGTVNTSSAGACVRGHFHAGSTVTATSIARTIASCGGGKTEAGRKFTATGVYSKGEEVRFTLDFYDNGPQPVTLFFQ